MTFTRSSSQTIEDDGTPSDQLMKRTILIPCSVDIPWSQKQIDLAESLCYTRKVVMQQVTVEILRTVDLHTMFGIKHYEPGIHTVDRDLAKLLFKTCGARKPWQSKTVPVAKQGRH